MIPESTTRWRARYERIRSMIARDECVILDGAMGTESDQGPRWRQAGVRAAL